MNDVLAGLTAVTLAFSTLLLTACSAPDTEAQSSGGSIEARFVGNWELLSYVSFDTNGGSRDNNYIGRIVYDANGNMSAVGMPRDLPDRAPDENGRMARAGFAYFSTYTVDAEGGRVIHHVIGSPMNPNWVGTDLIRYFEFTDDQLALSIRNAEGRVVGTLTWRRM